MTLPSRIGKYEIVEQIGVGGFGVVYKARDPYLERWVALKTCSVGGEEASQRFFREARLAGALQHPNITLIFDFGIEDGTPYFVQEYLTGIDLDALLKRGRPTLRGALAILAQVCAGLECAHARGIVHRDIKPANIRILPDGTVKIMDFGIAKSLQTDIGLTQTGTALGTAGYLAPEQVSGGSVDARTDLFSLGVIAYELVTGTRPFKGTSLSNVLYKIAHDAPPPLRRLNPRCPQGLEAAVLTALAKEPADRFASVREFAWKLEEAQTQLGDTGGSRLESTIAVVRSEVEELQARLESGGAGGGAAIEDQVRAVPDGHAAIEDTPLDRLPSDEPAPAPRRSHAARTALAVAIVAAAALAYLGLGGRLGLPGAPASLDLPALLGGRPTPSPSPVPTPLPTPVPTPEPTAVPTPVPVTVSLFVDPPSLVEVDGRSLGKIASGSVTLPAGEHEFVQRIPGYAERTRTLTVSPDTDRIALRLPPFGYVSVINDFGVPLKGARVFVDGTALGPLPVQGAKIAAGRHRLSVVWPGGREHVETIEVPVAGTLHRTVHPD